MPERVSIKTITSSRKFPEQSTSSGHSYNDGEMIYNKYIYEGISIVIDILQEKLPRECANVNTKDLRSCIYMLLILDTKEQLTTALKTLINTCLRDPLKLQSLIDESLETIKKSSFISSNEDEPVPSSTLETEDWPFSG